MTEIAVHVIAEFDHRVVAHWCNTCHTTHADTIAGVGSALDTLEPGDILAERRHPLCPQTPADDEIYELTYAGTVNTIDDLTSRRTTTLYRLHGGEGQLLYIGIAGNPGRRFEQHHTHRAWWSDVTHITVEHHPDRASAEAAEQAAIRAERPVHNVTHQASRRSR